MIDPCSTGQNTVKWLHVTAKVPENTASLSAQEENADGGEQRPFSLSYGLRGIIVLMVGSHEITRPRGK